jgi:transcriptional antiterminator NusG
MYLRMAEACVTVSRLTDLGPSYKHTEQRMSSVPCPADTRPSWFALRVKPNHEQRVSELLHFQGYEEFLPTYCVRRHVAQRWRNVEIALFRGYVFSRFDRQSWPRIINTPGVIDVVRIGRSLAVVDEQEIEALQIVQHTKTGMEPSPHWNTGQTVRITAGPLAVRPGKIVDFKSSTRLLLSVSLLQRAVLAKLRAIGLLTSKTLKW